MDTDFPIKILKKNQTLIDLSFSLMIAGFIGILLFYLSMTPSKNSSLELQTLWFIEGVPLWVKKAFLYGAFVLLIGIIIWYLNGRAKKGMMYVKYDRIIIVAGKTSSNFLYNQLREIALVSGWRYLWTGSSKMMLVLRTKDKITRIKILFHVTVEQMTEYLESAASNNVQITIDTSDPYSYRSK